MENEMHLEENRPSPTPKILLQNSASVIQMFVFTIVFSILFINYNEMIKISREQSLSITMFDFFVIFTPTPPLLTLNPKA